MSDDKLCEISKTLEADIKALLNAFVDKAENRAEYDYLISRLLSILGYYRANPPSYTKGRVK